MPDTPELAGAPRKVAVVGPHRLLESLGELPGTVSLRRFDDLYAEAPSLRAFEPDVLVLGPGPSFLQDAGALRVLSSLLPALVVMVVTADIDPAQHAEIAKLADAAGFAVVARASAGAALRRCLAERRSADPDAGYLQFVQGICDEINNPLMFASGHLQLLRAGLDPESDRRSVAAVDAVRQGLARIERTMRKVGAMGRASFGRRHDATFVMPTLLAQASDRLRGAGLPVQWVMVDAVSGAPAPTLRGDLELLVGALTALGEVGCELHTKPAPLELRAGVEDGVVTCRMRVDNAQLQEWELPRAFAPYQLNEVLRGTSLGLNLFLVDLVVRAHGWRACATRLSAQSVEFCITCDDGTNGRG